MTNVSCSTPCINGTLNGTKYTCHQSRIDNLNCKNGFLSGTEVPCELPCRNRTMKNYGKDRKMTCWKNQTCLFSIIINGSYVICSNYYYNIKDRPCLNGFILGTKDECRIMVETTYIPPPKPKPPKLRTQLDNDHLVENNCFKCLS